MSKVTIPVQGMSCSSCIQSVEGALMRVGGVARAKASLNPAQVEVEFDSALATREDLEQGILDAGYEIPAALP